MVNHCNHDSDAAFSNAFFMYAGVCVCIGTYDDGQQFAISEMGRDVVGLGFEGLSVPVSCFLQPVQPHVGLS